MIAKKQEIPSMYDEKKFKRTRLQVNKLHLFGILLILLMIFRFLNLFMWWVVNKSELIHKPADKHVNYAFLGFSNYKSANQKRLQLAQKQPAGTTAPTTVVSYFNLLHPGIFLIQNNERLSPVDLGKVIVTAEPGFSTFKLYLSDIIEKKENHNIYSTRFKTSILSKVLFSKDQTSRREISFLLKSPEKSKYLKIPYLVYFYIPLLMIIILSYSYTGAVLTSFFYYPILFLLFDFRDLFFTVPFQWLTQSLSIKVPGSLEDAAAVFVVFMFTLLGIIGLSKWKKRRDIFNERLMVLFFLFLPLFLRF